MIIHNILEERVIEQVNLMYEQVKKLNPSWFSCDCALCRLDTACYVLNRMQPRYILSGIGAIYSSVSRDFQLNADVDTLVMEGIRLVSSAKRAYHDSFCETPSPHEGPAFYFPSVIGTVCDGLTFDFLAGVEVRLTRRGQDVPMTNVTWSNPCRTTASARGSYGFWAAPILTQEADKEEVFSFTLSFSAQGYDCSSYSFDIPVVSTNTPPDPRTAAPAVKIQNMYLFPLEA